MSKIISYITLLALVVIPFLFAFDVISIQSNKTFLLISTVVWFATAPFWMGRKTT